MSVYSIVSLFFLKMGLVVLIQYRLWQTATQPRCRSYYRAYCVAQVKIDQFILVHQKLANKKYFQTCLKTWRHIGRNHKLWLVGVFCLKYPFCGTTWWRWNWLKYMKLIDFYMIQVIQINRTEFFQLIWWCTFSTIRWQVWVNR